MRKKFSKKLVVALLGVMALGSATVFAAPANNNNNNDRPVYYGCGYYGNGNDNANANGYYGCGYYYNGDQNGR